MIARLGTCTVDGTGKIVTFVNGIQRVPGFDPSWQGLGTPLNPGLQMVIGGKVARIQTVNSPTTMTLASSIGAMPSPVPFLPNRETLYQALFNLVSQAPGLVTWSRRTMLPQNVDGSDQPALFMDQRGENPERQGQGIPYMWRLEAELKIYCYSGDTSIPPATLLNPILDAIEAMFPPQIAALVPQTFGGLCVEARLQGDGKGEAGTIGNQAVAFVPVMILAI